MSNQVAKSFEVKFGERVTVRTSPGEWAKLEAVAKSRGQTLERLIQEAEQYRPSFILRPEWLRQVTETRGYCCKYYRSKKENQNMQIRPISLPAYAPVAAGVTPHELLAHLAEHASWNVPAIPMRELNSNEAVDLILNSKVLQASPRIDVTGGKGGVYVLFSPDTKEPHLCLYSPRGKCFVFDLTKMPDSLTPLMEDMDFEYVTTPGGTVELKNKPFMSVKKQLGM